MKDLMIDIETLGTDADAPVLSVGACFFDIATGEIGPTFDGKISVADALEYGPVCGETFAWWMQQSDEARLNVIQGHQTTKEILTGFHFFVARNCDIAEVRPWGHGAAFDITIIERLFAKALGDRVDPADRRSPPWNFRNVRDTRTIRALGEAAGHQFTGDREGTHHDALDDAVYQAKWVSFFWRRMVQGAPISEFID